MSALLLPPGLLTNRAIKNGNTQLACFYLLFQVKNDLLAGLIYVTDDIAVKMAALALQVTLGDFDPARHATEFVACFKRLVRLVLIFHRSAF